MLLNSPADMAMPEERPAARCEDQDEDSIGEHPCPAMRSRISPWLAPIMYAIGEKIILPAYFSKVEVIGQENIPTTGPVLLAPTHQAYWDSLLVGLVGKRAGRYLRFMVTADECLGIQGWFVRRLGGFPVHVRRPAVQSLRHSVELLQAKEMLVIYPEGNIFRDRINSLKPGLARIALRAERSRPNLDIKIIPITLTYSNPYPKWRGTAKIRIGQPISVAEYKAGGAKLQSRKLTADLQNELIALGEQS